MTLLGSSLWPIISGRRDGGADGPVLRRATVPYAAPNDQC